ncbi:MAG: hypothetical protein K0T99_00635 [Alphaproteobacteria bacterium]|nr:hypothetical protein [Alphaproteobacteria bacterium]
MNKIVTDEFFQSVGNPIVKLKLNPEGGYALHHVESFDFAPYEFESVDRAGVYKLVSSTSAILSFLFMSCNFCRTHSTQNVIASFFKIFLVTSFTGALIFEFFGDSNSYDYELLNTEINQANDYLHSKFPCIVGWSSKFEYDPAKNIIDHICVSPHRMELSAEMRNRFDALQYIEKLRHEGIEVISELPGDIHHDEM